VHCYRSRGLSLFLKDIKKGAEISNLELRLGCGGQIARAAGSCAKVLGLRHAQRRIRMPSFEIKSIDFTARATIGPSNNLLFNKRILSKAGTRRKLGGKSVVRGTAMNAVDHPHGGKSGPSRSSMSP
jgi:large subunit ribosomal protein L2